MSGIVSVNKTQIRKVYISNTGRGNGATGVHRAFTDGYQGESIEHSQMDPTKGSRKGGTRCPGAHSEHSLMDTRVGPIEHSQMDPAEGSSEGGTRRPTVPWRPFRASPDGYQGRAHRSFSDRPHRGEQEHKMHPETVCTAGNSHACFSRVIEISSRIIVGVPARNQCQLQQNTNPKSVYLEHRTREWGHWRPSSIL